MRRPLSLFIYGAFFILAALACSSPATEEPVKDPQSFRPELVTREDSLLHDILEAHDFGMARMMKLSRYRSRIKKDSDSLQQFIREKRVDTLKRLDAQLAHAEFLMQEWMDHFRLDTLREVPAQRLKYLESEQQKVEEMKAALVESLSLADSLYLKK